MRLPISARLAIEQADERLGARVRQIRELEHLTRKLNRNIKRLRQALLTSGAQREEDLVLVPGGLEHPADPGVTTRCTVEQQHKSERVWARVRQMASELNLSAQRAVSEHIHRLGMARRCEVEAQLQRLHRQTAAITEASSTMVSELGHRLGATQGSVPAAQAMPA